MLNNLSRYKSERQELPAPPTATTETEPTSESLPETAPEPPSGTVPVSNSPPVNPKRILLKFSLRLMSLGVTLQRNGYRIVEVRSLSLSWPPELVLERA